MVKFKGKNVEKLTIDYLHGGNDLTKLNSDFYISLV